MPNSKIQTITVTRELTGPLSPSERVRYKFLLEHIHSKMEVVNSALRSVSRDLTAIKEERLYREDYDSFEAFFKSSFGKGREYGYRLIKAGRVLNELLEQGLREPDLPDSERLCRELAEYTGPVMKEIWSRAKEMALAAGKAKPEALTIRAAAAKIEGTPRAKRRACEQLIQKVEGIQRSLKISINWEEMEPREVRRILKALTYITAQAAAMIRSGPAPEVEEVQSDFESDHPAEDKDEED